MTDHDVRVALLARPGMARDQLHRALSEAGAQIVAEGDPAELDPKEVAEKLPTVFLVSLEPSIEKALDRFDGLLAAPGVEVMFDDAEVTGKLDGWDLNRWARHVASKLLGSESLPPIPEGAHFAEEGEVTLRPGMPPTPAELMDHAKLEDYTADTSELADWVPTSPSLTPPADKEKSGETSDEVSFSWDGSQAAVGDDNDVEFKLDTDLGIDLDLGELDFAPTPDPVVPAAKAPLEPILGDDMDFSESVRFSTFSSDDHAETLGDLDADVAQLAAQLEAFEKADQRASPIEPDFAKAPKTAASEKDDMEAVAVVSKKSAAEKKVADKAAAEASAAKAPKAAANFDFSNLALAPIDGELPPGPPIVPTFVPPREKTPELKTSELSLGDFNMDASAAAHDGLGAVLILAGLGGPDAVRQLLSSLPDKLPVPVLLYQHLEVGKHARLVEQLSKISRLPVVLACDGDSPVAGKVTLLPAGCTAVANGNSLRFTNGNLSQLISAMPPKESMIIVLSGADPQLVPLILSVKEEGGRVIAQDPDVCFDAAAADAMRKEGAAVYPALGLARQIAERWPV
jgi:chemotaxis response regulator CheB